MFQADPHLSNILALPNGDAANIDYGLVAELSAKEAKMCQNLIMAVYLKDLKKVLRIAADMTGVDYKEYAPVLEPDLKKYLEKTHNEGFGFWFLEFAKIMVNHKIKFPLYLTTFGRTNLMLDGLVRTYLPEKNTIDIVGGELRRKALREIAKNIFDIDWLNLLYSVGEQVKRAPQTIANFITDPLSVIAEVSRAIRSDS